MPLKQMVNMNLKLSGQENEIMKEKERVWRANYEQRVRVRDKGSAGEKRERLQV